MKNSTYDDDPVFYCKRCLSLNIQQLPVADNMDYCAECSSADVGQTDIYTWKRLYREKYGHDFVEKKELKWPYWC